MTKKSNLKTLSKGDTIKNGIYAGMKVSECLKVYGKKSIMEILKYYDLDEEILKEYHVHTEPHKEEEDNTPVSETSSSTIKYRLTPVVKSDNPWLDKSEGDEAIEGYSYVWWTEGEDEEVWYVGGWCIYKDGTAIYHQDNWLAEILLVYDGTFEPSRYEDIVESIKQDSFDWVKDMNMNEEPIIAEIG